MDLSLIERENTRILRVEGELDALSSPELRPTLDVLTRDRGCTIVVDLSKLKLLDASGGGALVFLYKRVRANQGSVRFVGVANQPLSIFKLLRLDHVFALAA